MDYSIYGSQFCVRILREIQLDDKQEEASTWTLNGCDGAAANSHH